MQRFAAFVDDADPDILAVCEIDAGDALALATRFTREWAYRGAQALFWRAPVRAQVVHDLYLPYVLQRPFDRRGLLRIDAEDASGPLAIFATQFAPDRTAAIAEVRFANKHVQEAALRTVAFVQGGSTPALVGRGVVTIAEDEASGLRLYTRGFTARTIERGDYSLIVVVDSQGIPPPQ